MLHQMLVSYKYIASEDDDEEDNDAEKQDDDILNEYDVPRGSHEKPQYFTVKTDKEGLQFKVKWDRKKKQIFCGCPFYTMNEMICAHAFCLMNALQIKHINYFSYLGDQWSEEINPEDPSTRDLMAKVRQQKKLITFIDKVAEKNR